MAENTNYYDLYKALKADGAVKGDWNSFRSFVGASGKQGYLNRKKLYDALKADGAVKAGTYEEFHSGLYKAGKQWKAQRQNTASANKPSTVRNMAAQVANEYHGKGGADYLSRPQAQRGNGITEVPKNASPFVQSLYETDNAMKGAEYPINYTSPNAVKQVYEKNQQVKRDASRTAAKQNEWNRQNQPIYDNGTKGVMKTQGQLEKEIDDAAGKFIDSNMGDYISKAILDEQNAAMERGLEASDRVPATAGGAGGLGLMLKGMVFNKEVDPDVMGRNLSKSVQDNIQKIFSDPRYVKQIENEAAALGISTDGYIQSLASHLQGKLLSELDKSELKNALPKNGLENFANRFIGSNVLGNMIKTATQTKSQRAIDEQAMAATEAGENPYYKPGIWENVAADVAGMATDPVFHGSAGIGGKVAGKLVGSSDKIGAMLANGNVMQRLGLNVGQAVTSGGVTGFVFGSSKGAIQNVSTGEDTSLGGTLKAALHGGLSEAGSFATMGVAGVPLGMVGRSVGLKSITTTPLTKEWFKQGSAKVGLETAKTWMEGTGMYLGGYVAGKIEGREQPEFDIIDGTIESLPTAIGFRVQHLLKGLGSGRLRGEDGKELSWGKSTMLKFNEFLTSDKAKASKYLMSEDERNQILNSEATKEIMRSGDNMVSIARRAKSNKISYDDPYLETDMSMIRNSYDKIMADPNVSWDAKAKFSAMVMGVMPSSRPMADYHTFTLEKLGDNKVGCKKYINEYSANGELLSKISYDTAEQRGDILYRRSVNTESNRFWNAYAALVNIEKNDYDLQNQFFAHEMKNWVRGDGNEERFMAGMKGYSVSTYFDKYTAYVADRSKLVSASLRETAERIGMSEEELVKAVNKDPLKRTDAEQNACVELRKTFEKAAYPEGKAHEEQSKLDGKDVARENGLGTDAPNGEAVKQELVSLQEAEDGLQKLMDSNDVFKESYDVYKGQGLTNVEIYQRMIEEGGMTEEQLAPFALYINANARVQGMQDATEQAVEQHVESVAADWGFHGTMDGQKADGSQIIYVKDSNGRTLIVGSGDVAYDPATGKPKEGVGDMLVCLDMETRQPVYVKVEDTSLAQTQSVEDFKNEERARLQQINSEPYNEAAQEQAMSNATKTKGSEREDGQSLIQSPEDGSAAALSALPPDPNGGKGTKNDQNTQEKEVLNTDSFNKNTESPDRISNEKDEWGQPLVKASDGSVEFGKIDEGYGLQSAPIRLSLGENKKNPETGKDEGYGLLHIIARHGDQIRKAGYKSVQDFVEDVAKGYTEIREGVQVGTTQTYLIVKKDGHANTLYIELSRDGKYWNINSAGIFKEKYVNRKKEITPEPTVGSSTSTDTTGVNHGTTEGAAVTSGNSPVISNGKVNEKSSNGNGNGVTLTFADGSPVPMVKDSKGRETPDYGRMKPEQAADILTRQFGESAEKVADGQISKAEKAVKKAENMKVNYEGEPNDILEQEAVRREAIAEAQRQLEHAQATKKAMTAKKVAEAMGKTEEKPTEGANQAGSVAAERFHKATRLVGNKRSRTLPNNEKITGHYEIVPAESLTPSHDATNGYRKSEGFPVDAEGRTTNDRDYENDKAAQQSTDQMALGYNGQAIEQVPVVSDEGIVYDGNGRTMAGQKAAKEGTDGEYISELLDNAESFGFTREQIEGSGIEHPRLVLVSDERMPYTTETFAKFNRNEKKTQSNTEQAVAKSKTLSPEDVGSIVAEIEGNGSLEAFFNNPRAISSLWKTLQEKGIIGQNEVAGLQDMPGVPNAQGKEFVKNLVLGAMFKPETIRMMGIDSTIKNKVIGGIRAIMDNSKLGDYSLGEEMDAAIRLLYEARTGNMSVDDLLRSSDFVQGNARDRYSHISQAMAQALEGKASLFRELMSEYNDIARNYNTAEGSLGFYENLDKEGLIRQFVLKSKTINDNNIKLYGEEGRDSEKKGSDVPASDGQHQEEAGGGVSEERRAEEQQRVDNAVKKLATEITRKTGVTVHTDEKESQKALKAGLHIDNTVREHRDSRWAGGEVLGMDRQPDDVRMNPNELYSEISQYHGDYITRKLDKVPEDGTITFFSAHDGKWYFYSVDKDHSVNILDAITASRENYDEFKNKLKDYGFDGSSKAVREDMQEAGYTGRTDSDKLDSFTRGGFKESNRLRTGDSEGRQGPNGHRDSKSSDETGSKPMSESENGEIRQFRTKDGEVYGFVVGGEIHLDTKKMKPETPLHEYTHLWTSALQRVNAKEWENVKKLLDSVDGLKEEVQKLYPELKGDDLYDEMLATYSGREGAKKLEETAKGIAAKEGKSLTDSVKAQSFLGKVREALKRYWKATADMLHVKFTSAEEVADKVLADWASGENPNFYRSEEELGRLNDIEQEWKDKIDNYIAEKYPQHTVTRARTKEEQATYDAEVEAMRNDETLKRMRKDADAAYEKVRAEIYNTPLETLKKSADEYNEGKLRYQKAEADDIEATAKEHGVDATWLARYAEGMREKNSATASRYLHDLKAMYLREHIAEKKALMEREGVSGLIANRRLFAPIEKAIKEKYGDVDVLIEERKKQVEAERNVMEAARKRAEEEERKRQLHLEELSLIPDGDLDKRYLEAMEKGDEATAREMLDEAARRKGYGDVESDYQGVGAWNAPSNPGYESDEARRNAVGDDSPDLNVEDMAAGYSNQPEDVFLHPKEYSQGLPTSEESGRAIQDAIDAIRSGKTDVKIKVYRAVPISVKEGKLRNGDWVTPSRRYAEMHGEHRLDGKCRIMEDEVPAKELWWDSNDVNEWGYDNGNSYRYRNVKNNRKLNDLVTRDDKGNIIPPSKRFNSRKADERYQKVDEEKAKADKRERALRDEVVGTMRKAGLDVSMDTDEGQRMLDEANGKVKMSAKKRRALETVSISQDGKHQQTAISSADGAKVLNNLDSLVKDLENSPIPKEKTFIGDVANSLGIDAKDKSSKYATFETKNSKIITIRLSNHNAKVSNFDHRDESEGISIVVSPKKSVGMENDGEAHVVEYYYDAIKLRRAEGKPLAEIVKSIKQALYSGDFNDTTGLAERQEVNGGLDHVRFFRTADGEAYGYTIGGKIYIDPRIANSETPVHEYAHLWATALRNGNAKEWANVVGLMKDTKVWDEVRKRYPELEGDNDIADEVLATYSGRRGAERLRKEMDGAGENAKGALERVKQAIRKFWKATADMLHIHYTSAEDVADRVMKDLLDGVDPREFGGVSERVRKQFIGERGAEKADRTEEVNTRLENLRVARKMEAESKDAKAIKMATGWERGADGKWRYEIADGKLSEYFDVDGKGTMVKRFEEDMLWTSGKLGDVVDAPEIFKAYPQLKDVELDTDSMTGDMPSNGEYNPNTNRITIHADELKYLNSILNHEIQHVIQHLEGFAIGGSEEGVEREFQKAKAEWAARAYAHELEETAKELGDDHDQVAVEKALLKEYEDMDMQDWLPDKDTRMKGFNYFARGYADRSMDDAIKRFRLDESVRGDFNPYTEYRKLAGEVEARNVQKRMGMTPEERRASLAAETEDVAREDQIFLRGGEQENMAHTSDPMDALTRAADEYGNEQRLRLQKKDGEEKDDSSEKLFLSLQSKDKQNNKKEYYDTVSELARRIESRRPRLRNEGRGNNEGERQEGSYLLPTAIRIITKDRGRTGLGDEGSFSNGRPRDKWKSPMRNPEDVHDYWTKERISELENSIVEWAKTNNCFISEKEIKAASPNGKMIGRGNEANVYLSQDGTKVIKFAKYNELIRDTPTEYLDDMEAFNNVFPASAYKILGVARQGKGKLRFVLEQPYINGKRYYASDLHKYRGEPFEKVRKLFLDMGFKEVVGEEGIHFYNDKYDVNDISYANVVFKDGKPVIIDASVSTKRRNVEKTLRIQNDILRHLEKEMQENPNEYRKRYLTERIPKVKEEISATRKKLTEIIKSDASKEGDTHFRMELGKTFSNSKEDFDGVRDRAVEEKGIVMPNLNKESVNVVPIEKHSFGENIKGSLENANKWAKENIATNSDKLPTMRDGTPYTISKAAIDKYLSKNATNKSENLGIHLSVLPKLTDVIHESIEAEIHPDYKKGEDGTRNAENGYGDNVLVHRLYGAVELDGKVYRVKTTMQEFRGGEENKPHSYEVTKIELLDGSEKANESDSLPLNSASNSSKNELPDSSGERENPDKPHSVLSDNSISVAKLLNGVEKSYDAGKKLLDESKNLTDGETAFRNINNASAVSDDAPIVVKHVSKVARKLGSKVNMVNSPDEVTNPAVRERLERGEKVTGWYDEKTGEVHLYMPNIHDRYTAEKTIWHETVGHKGMRGLLGDKFNDFLYQVWKDLDKPENAELKKLVDEELRYNPLNIYDAIEEGIARLAEDGKGEVGFWNTIKNKVTSMLRSIGYHMAPNTRDVKYLLWLSKNLQKNPNNPYWKMRAEAVRYKLEHEKADALRDNGGYFVSNEGKAHDGLLDLSHRDFEEATDGTVHFRTTPMTASKIQEYNRRLSTKTYAFKESTVDHLQSLQEAMEVISGEKDVWRNIPSAFNPLQAANRIDAVCEQLCDKYDRNFTKPLDAAFKAAVNRMGGQDGLEQKRNTELYMIQKHGLERNRVFYVRDEVRKLRKDEQTRQDADLLQRQWDAEKKDLDDKLRNGTVDLMDYYDQMDEWIRNNVDKTYIADEHDYSGFHEMQDKNDNENYDDQQAIDDVMSAESQLGYTAKELWDATKAATDATIDQEYNNGFIGREERDHLKGMFSYYVPLRRYDDTTAEEVYGYISEGSEYQKRVGTVIAKAKGRHSLSDVNVMAQISAMAKASIMNGGKNIVKQHLARFVSAYESGNSDERLFVEVKPWMEKHVVDGNEVWEEVTPQIPVDATQKQISDILQDFENDMQAKKAKGDAKEITRETSAGYKFERAKDKSQHLVEVYVAGKKRTFFCQGNPRAAQAVNGLLKDSGTKSWITRQSANLNRFCAQMNTSFNPDFMLSNMMRDLTFASANVTKEGRKYTQAFIGEYKRNLLSFFNGRGDGNFWTMFSKYRSDRLNTNDKRERYFKEFMENGGETGFVHMEALDKLMREYDNLIKTGKKTDKGWLMRKLSDGGGIIEAANEVIENLARYSTYAVSREQGRSIGRSIYDAKEVSTNFNRHGSGDAIGTMRTKNDGKTDVAYRKTLGFFNSYMKNHTMFYNAGIQGANLFVKNMKQAPATNIISFLAMPMGLGVATSIINQWLIGKEDKDERDGVEDPYAELPEWKRRNNLCFYVGKGRFVTIPIAIELRAFYGLADIAMGMFNPNLRSDTPVGYDILGQMAQLVPSSDFLGHHAPADGLKEVGKDALLSITPTTLKPVAELALNRDWTGRPIYRDKDYLDNAPRWKRAYDSTNGVYMTINQWANKATNGIDSSNEDMKGSDTADFLTAPYGWQHMVDGYLGGAFATMGRATNAGYALGKTIKDAVIGKEDFGKEWGEFDKNQIPFWRVFNYKATDGNEMQRTKSKWYNYADELKQTEYNVSQLKTNSPDVAKNLENAARKYNFYDTQEGKMLRIYEAADSYISKKRRLLKKVTDPETVKSIQGDINRKMQEAVKDLDSMN